MPLTKNTLTGIQNAKEYIGVGLSAKDIIDLYSQYDNFRAIKGEASSFLIQQEIKKISKRSYSF